MTTKMEILLGREFKKRFDQSTQPKFGKVLVSKKPFQVAALRKQWHEMYGKPLHVPQSLVPPLQPEIDMILWKKDEVTAVELKYFRRKGSGLNHSFYEGIEQSLALLRWGFDHVALWQLYEDSISPEELWFYGGWTWAFLHDLPINGGLNLPIEFSFFKVRKQTDGYDFITIQPRRVNGNVILEQLPPPYDPIFRMHSKYENPLLACSDVKKLRGMMMEWLSTEKSEKKDSKEWREKSDVNEKN